jgi:hypothetical protein
MEGRSDNVEITITHSRISVILFQNCRQQGKAIVYADQAHKPKTVALLLMGRRAINISSGN